MHWRAMMAAMDAAERDRARDAPRVIASAAAGDHASADAAAAEAAATAERFGDPDLLAFA
jgi:hypothetical protein